MPKQRRSPSLAERLASLAELLADPAAPWPEVFNALARWPPGPQLEAAIELVEPGAARWTPLERHLTPLVAQQLIAGVVRPYLRLLRTLDLRVVWSVRRRDLLLARLISEGRQSELHTFTTRYDLGDELIPLISRHITGLHSLNIGGSGVSSSGARTLAETSSLARLTSLSLHNNNIDDDGAAALLASPHLGALRYLNLYGNRISPAMIDRIHAAPQWRATRIVLHGRPSRSGYD